MGPVVPVVVEGRFVAYGLPGGLGWWRHGLAGALLVAAVLGPVLAASRAQDGGDPAAIQRDMMVRHQIEGRGIRTPRVLEALRRVPRHLFVPPRYRGLAYTDRPLPIGQGQTISQPYIVASMTDLVRVEPHHVVLEIGTGSGYQAAVLALLAREVVSMEIIPALAAEAGERLRALGYTNVTVIAGDGYEGYAPRAPYDAIVVTAGAPHVLPALVTQLRPGGRMAIPVGPTPERQHMLLVEKRPDGTVVTRSLYEVRFVPLVRPP